MRWLGHGDWSKAPQEDRFAFGDRLFWELPAHLPDYLRRIGVGELDEVNQRALDMKRYELR